MRLSKGTHNHNEAHLVCALEMESKQMTKHGKWIIMALVIAVLLAFCAAPARASSDSFQTQLDAARVVSA